MREIAVVAAPYAGADWTEISINVARATLIGRLATEMGYAPIVPHCMGFLGVHGDPQEKDDADSVFGSTRTKALECALAHVPLAHALFVLKRDNGDMSDGTREEFAVWSNTPKIERVLVMHTWAGYEQLMNDYGLIGFYRMLDMAAPPPRN